MARAVVFVSLLVSLLGLAGVYSAPQSSGSFSEANAQAGSFGGGYGPGFQGPYRPRFYGHPRPPGYGFGSPGFGSGFNNRGGSISISKSISISRGGGSAAQSSAQSSAVGK